MTDQTITPPREHAFQKFLRLSTISWVLLREYRTLSKVAHGATINGAPEKFAAQLVRLGPVFVKLGQILSTRPDVLPPSYIEALATLQENAPPVSIEEVHVTIARELGKPVDEVFATFDTVPVAAASLAQVHRATLQNGTAVAVKIQRPDLERLMKRDLDAMESGMRWLYRVLPGRMRRTNLRDFFAEFRRYTRQELDFLNEARIIGRFRANFATRTDVKFPVVHWKETTRRVLTMDWVEGMRVREAATVLDHDQRHRLVTLLIDVLLQMFVADGLFHADLHRETYSFTVMAHSRCSISACTANSRRHNATDLFSTGSRSFNDKRAARSTTSRPRRACCLRQTKKHSTKHSRRSPRNFMCRV